MSPKERIAYLRGLIEGSGYCSGDPQAKAVWENLLAICDSLASAVQALQDEQDETKECVEAIDSALSDLEGEVYGCDDDDDEEDIVEMECPNCGEEVCFEEDFLYDSDVEVSCPECGAVVYATGESATECDHKNGTAAEAQHPAGDDPGAPGSGDA